jgi:hypothetical protein
MKKIKQKGTIVSSCGPWECYIYVYCAQSIYSMRCMIEETHYISISRANRCFQLRTQSVRAPSYLYFIHDDDVEPNFY